MSDLIKPNSSLIEFRMQSESLPPLLEGHLFVLARNAGGVGTDGLAEMLCFVAETMSIPARVIELGSARRGPCVMARQESSRFVQYGDDELVGAVLETLMANENGITVLALSAHAFQEYFAIESQLASAFRGSINLIWLHSSGDPLVKVPALYRKKGGLGRCFVATRESQFVGGVKRTACSTEIVQADTLNGSFEIPTIPDKLARRFFSEETSLRDALDGAELATKLTFWPRMIAFKAELERLFA